MTPSNFAPTTPPVAALARATPGDRLVAALIGALCAALLVLASTLTPDPAGHATHTQLGMPRCGMVIATGYPCPTCGMTTAFAHAARGDLLASARVQPLGAVLALLTAGVFWVCLYITLTGSRVGAHAARLISPRTLGIALALALVSWGWVLARWTGDGADVHPGTTRERSTHR